jgi:CRISPR-associated protein Csb2
LPAIDYREVSQLHSRTAGLNLNRQVDVIRDQLISQSLQTRTAGLNLNRQVDERRSPHAFGTDGAFRLRFPAPVTGPIAVGHSCHFGLGLLLPAGAME